MALFQPAKRPPARYQEYDPRWARIAEHIVQAGAPFADVVRFEHVGSTAVPGCGGKGIIDMLALYPPGRLDEATEVLRRLGLHPQGDDFPHPFPPERPMYLGTIQWDGQPFVVYVHVLDETSPEAERFRMFRNQLARRDDVRLEYTRVKRAIIDSGVIDSDRYRQAKTGIIKEILGADRDSPDQSG